MALDLSSLNIRSLATSDNSKEVIDLDLTLINEDPEQPRSVFLKKELDEMADSIKERGVKSPISVRVNPDDAGKYIINHGARRYRASILAAKKTIPAIIDNDYTFIDQIIENLQRQDLEPMEMCNAINKLLDNGMKKQEVAKALGVSNAYITQYSNLNKLPEILEHAFESKKIEDVTVINELMTLLKKNPDSENEINKWINKQELITRAMVKDLRKKIEEREERLMVIEDTPEIQNVKPTAETYANNNLQEDSQTEVENLERIDEYNDSSNSPIDDDNIELESVEATEEETLELFQKPNYDHITQSQTIVIEVSKEQAAAILWAYDRGFNDLDAEAMQEFKSLIHRMKDEIWP